MIVRFICSAISGFFLSQSGTITQRVFQNPIAGPSTLGFLGISVFLYTLGFFLNEFYEVNSEIFCILSHMVLALLLVPLSLQGKIERVLKVGIGVNLLVVSLFSLVHFVLLTKGESLPSSIWFGSFKWPSEQSLAFFLIVMTLNLLWIIFRRKYIARSFFAHIFVQKRWPPLRFIEGEMMAWSFFLQGLVVSFFGVFSFFSIVLPLLIRKVSFFSKNPMSELILGSALSGGVLAILDACCYLFPLYGTEIPVSLISSIVGPVLLILYSIKEKRSYS